MAFQLSSVPASLSQALRGGDDDEDDPVQQTANALPVNGRYIPFAPTGPVASPATTATGPTALRAAMNGPEAPSDDPELSPLPTAPDLSNSPMAKVLKDYSDTQQKIQAIQAPDPAKMQPRLYQRLAGFAAGTAAGLRNPQVGEETARDIANRDYNRAQSSYQAQVAPLERQLQSDREALPLAEAQSKIPQQSFENELKLSQEQRNRQATQGRVAWYESRAKELTGKFISGTEKQDPNSPTGWSAETFDGDLKPFTPPSYAKKPVEPKSADEAYAAASAAQKSGDTAEYKRLTSLGDQMTKVQRGNIAAEHPNKDLNEGGWTPGESREIDSRSRRFQMRINALEKARTDLIGSNNAEDKASLQEMDNEIEQNQKQIDSIEQDVMSRRNGGKGSSSASSQPNQSGPDPSLWKDKSKVLVTRNRSGAVQRWKLQDGKPVLISEERK